MVALALILMTLAGCEGSPPWTGSSRLPDIGLIQTALGQPEAYDYFTDYQIYYNRATREYLYRDGAKWVSRKEPPAPLTAAALWASPSVPMDFHNAPERQPSTALPGADQSSPSPRSVHRLHP